MKTSIDEMIDAFEKLAEAGDGVIAVPPQNEEEAKERDRRMQKYLRKLKSEKVAPPQK